jgi:hypothetical protein
MPGIPGTWETKIGRIVVQGQPRQSVHETLCQPVAGHGGTYLSSQATWKAEIVVLGQPSQRVVRLHLNGKKLSMVVGACHPSYGRKYIIGRSRSRSAWTKRETLSPNNQNKNG